MNILKHINKMAQKKELDIYDMQKISTTFTCLL